MSGRSAPGSRRAGRVLKVCLMRHGEAKPKELDPERGLTEAGRTEAEAVARAVARGLGEARQIWHSGKRRAEQTAGILADLLASGRTAPPRVVRHGGLDPDDPVEPIAAELAALDHDLAVVGHLPFLERLAAKLLGLEGEGVRLLEF